MELIIDLSDNDFQGFLMETKMPVVVCFWCKRIPDYKKIRQKFDNLAFSIWRCGLISGVRNLDWAFSSNSNFVLK